MKKILNWIKIACAIITGVFTFLFVKEAAKKLFTIRKSDKIDSPLPFSRDKKNRNIIYVNKSDEWVKVQLPSSVENKNIKAVQINKNDNRIMEVQVKHETIDFSGINNSGSGSLDL